MSDLFWLTRLVQERVERLPDAERISGGHLWGRDPIHRADHPLKAPG